MQYCKSFPCPSLNRDSYWLSSPSTSSDSLHCLPVATLFRRLPWDAIVHFIATLGQVALSLNAGRSIQSLRHSHVLLCKQLYINFVSSCSVLHDLAVETEIKIKLYLQLPHNYVAMPQNVTTYILIYK